MSLTYAQILTFVSILIMTGCNKSVELKDYKDLSFLRKIKIARKKKEKAFLSLDISPKKSLGFVKIVDSFFSQKYLFILQKDKLSMFDFSAKKIADFSVNTYQKVVASSKEVLLVGENFADLFALEGQKLSLNKKITLEAKNTIFRVFFVGDSVVIVTKNGNILWFNKKGEKFAEITLNLSFSTLGCSVDDEGNVLITNPDSFYKFKDGNIVDLIQLNNIGKPSGVILQNEDKIQVARTKQDKTTCIFSRNSLLISDANGQNFKRYDLENRKFSLFGDQLFILDKDYFLTGTPKNLYDNIGLEKVEFTGVVKHMSQDLIILNGFLMYFGRTLSQKVDFANMKEIHCSLSNGNIERRKLVLFHELGEAFLCTISEKCAR